MDTKVFANWLQSRQSAELLGDFMAQRTDADVRRGYSQKSYTLPEAVVEYTWLYPDRVLTVTWTTPTNKLSSTINYTETFAKYATMLDDKPALKTSTILKVLADAVVVA